jgi:hypothetical protein
MAIALALAGCGRHEAQTSQNAYPAATLPPLPASLPLSTAPVTAPIMPAPPVSGLPRARSLDYGYVPPEDDYAWIDRADMLFNTIGDAPPDYGFDYDGVEPWAWETADDYEIVAEPIDDGYRTYYYEPGADWPFLVSDPSYSYGYGDGRLIAVYAGGRLLGRDEAARQADAAARYWARGQALRRADQAVDRRPVSAFLWAQQQPVVERTRQRWTQARVQDPAWQQWRARQPNGPAMARLQAEHQVRSGAAQRFAQWQRAGLNGPAPRLYPAGAVRRSAEPIMRPERPMPFAASRPQRLANAAREPGLPHVQAAPAAGRPAMFAQARAQQAERRAQRQAVPFASRAAFRNAVPARAMPERPAHMARMAAATARQERPAPRFERQAAAAPMRARREAVFAPRQVRAEPRMAAIQTRREAAFVPRQFREPSRAAPVQARHEEAFVQRQAQQQARMAQVQAHAQARAEQMQARQQARVAFHAAPPPQAHAAPAPTPHGGGGPHGGPPPQAAARGGGGGGGHEHGHGH